MKKLIVNADDFGLHTCVNQAIIQGHTNGCITSASVMPTGSAFEDAIHLALKTPSLGIGVHLTLVSEKPLLSCQKVNSLVSSNGYFKKDYMGFIQEFLRKNIDLKEVYLELSAQIEAVCQTGVKITHIDSHQHLHILPGIIDIVIDLAKQYEIKAIRIPAEPYFFAGGYNADIKRFLSKCGLTFLSTLARNLVRKNHLMSTQHFFGMLAGGNMFPVYFSNIIDTLPEGSSEIMIHPGINTDVLQEHFGWNYHWESELNAVMEKNIIEKISNRHIQLCSFGALVNE